MVWVLEAGFWPLVPVLVALVALVRASVTVWVLV
jgi:hypothetical protein